MDGGGDDARLFEEVDGLGHYLGGGVVGGLGDVEDYLGAALGNGVEHGVAVEGGEVPGVAYWFSLLVGAVGDEGFDNRRYQ